MLDLKTAIAHAGQSLAILSEVKQPLSFQSGDKISLLFVKNQASPQPVRALFVIDLEPSEVIQEILKFTLVSKFSVHHFTIQKNFETLKQPYQTYGYNFNNLLYLLVSEATQSVPELKHKIYRVTTLEQLNRIKKVTKEKLLLEHHLNPENPMHLYVAEESGQIVAWLQMTTLENFAWISDLFTLPAFRKQGIAGSILDFASHEAVLMGVKHLGLFSAEQNLEFYSKKDYVIIAKKLRFSKRASLIRRVLRRLKRFVPWFVKI